MAIAFDAAATSSALGASSLTYSHTCTGSNLILWVSAGVNSADASDHVTGVTYNGVAMTRAVASINAVANEDPVYLYYLVAPATGAHNVVVSLNASKDVYSVASSYTGAAQTGQPDATTSGATGLGTANSLSMSLTVVASGCWVISAATDEQSGSPSAGTGLSSTRSSQTFESVTADTNGTVSTGSYSVTWNRAIPSLIGAVAASFAPVAAVGGTTPRLRSLLGVGL
jgi:hypothetical protein